LVPHYFDYLQIVNIFLEQKHFLGELFLKQFLTLFSNEIKFFFYSRQIEITIHPRLPSSIHL